MNISVKMLKLSMNYLLLILLVLNTQFSMAQNLDEKLAKEQLAASSFSLY